MRRFIELCGQRGLNFVLRIGPFVHGEWRNGGLPDWLYGQPFGVRSNDPRYLAHVGRFYNEIGAQVEGLLFRDGGPIIAIHIENEYMHAGAPWETVDFIGNNFQVIIFGAVICDDTLADCANYKPIPLQGPKNSPWYCVRCLSQCGHAWAPPILCSTRTRSRDKCRLCRFSPGVNSPPRGFFSVDPFRRHAVHSLETQYLYPSVCAVDR